MNGTTSLAPLSEKKRKALSKKQGAGKVAYFHGLKAWTGVFYAFLYFPIIVLITYSFNSSRFAMIWEEFSFRWYIKMFESGDIGVAALNSLKVATCATILATCFATAAALAIGRGGNFKGKTAASGLMALPIMVPEIVTAIATLIFFSTVGISLGIGNLIIAHTVFCIPFAYLPIRARVEGMNSDLEQASRDLYATEWQAFRYVTVPLLMPGIFAGATLSFVISLDDFIISLMISEAGTTTLPVYIFGMIRKGVTPEVNAISTVLFAVSLVLVSIYWLTTKKAENKH